MLYLTRKPKEAIIINNNIYLEVVEVQGNSVKLGLTFPKSCSVLRKELFDSIKEENARSMQLVLEANLGSN